MADLSPRGDKGHQKDFSAIKILAVQVTFGGKLGFIPYTWDWESNMMQYKPGWTAKLMHYIWFIVLGTYGVFLVANCFVVFHDESVPEPQKIRVAYMCTVHILLDVGFLLNLQTFGQHHVVINQLVEFTKSVHGTFGLQIRGKALKTVLGVTTFVYFFGCTNAVAVFASPRSRRLLTSLWDEPEKLPKGTKFILMIIHLLLNAGQFFYMQYNASVMYTYVYYITPVIKRLGWTSAEDYRNLNRGWASQKAMMRRPPSCHPQLSPRQLYHVFNSVLVLQAKFTKAYGSWIFLIIIYVIVLAILNVFQAAVFDSVRAFVLALSLCTLIARVLKTCGEAYETSAQAVKSWGGIKYPTWFPKFQLAARPARIPIGSFFFFDRGVMPTFMNIILTTGANMIISYGNKRT